MSRLSVGEDLATRLYAAESAIDQALIETATLAAALPAARAGAWLSAVTGQSAFEGTAEAMRSLAGARAHIVQTHNTLTALARKLGLDALAVGPLDKPGDGAPVGGGDADGGGITENVVNKTLPISTDPC
jgi:glutamine phosphoribosylpyrophosphate amidotransferase